MNEKLSLVLDAKATLAEGPCWDHDRQLLYWVDIEEHLVNQYDPKTGHNRSVDVGQYVGALAVTHSGELILALEHGFHLFNMETEELKMITEPERDMPENRFNDGKCDPAGRFLAGSMAFHFGQKSASLYSLDTDFSVRRQVDQVVCSNGLAWSLDHKTMYYIDSPTKLVVAYDYDIETGEIANKREVITIPEGEGVPDGMTIDDEGMLWIAQWGGSQVSRWNPEAGEKIGSISIPATQVTSCAFGGVNMDELYITTARNGLDDAALQDQPLAGGVFKYQADVKGVQSFKFGKV
ncbi:SMP-30/gluconolactonase/LRE family protein [Radiobacillus sp. PE A8.2]|uniref:SMP-30/gluconolactonase/LRE family protein n=1 Tax=Radiobacillus sp. PE A8.2 TaxID=3380349 RepID=UPI00388F0EFE